MRIFRGTGLNGLCGISYKNRQIVRPILNIPRKEIEMYTKICHLEYMTDETNLVPIYTRNKIRLNVIPMIEKEFNKKFCSTMNDSIKSFNEDMEFINSVAYKEYTNITRKIGNGIHIETDKFLSLPKSIQKRIVMIAIEDINGSLKDVSTVSVNLVCDMFKKETGHITPIKNNVFAYKDYDAVIIAGQNIKRKNSDDTKKHIVIKECLSGIGTHSYILAEYSVSTLILIPKQLADPFGILKSGSTIFLTRHKISLACNIQKNNQSIYQYGNHDSLI